MFKDYSKYLSASIKVYVFVLLIVFILKLVGLDYFGLDVNNPTMLKLSEFCFKFHLTDLWYTFTLWIYDYYMLSITCNCNNKKMKIFSIICIPIYFAISYFETKYSIMIINCFIDFSYVLILSFIFNLKNKCVNNKKLLSNYIKIVLLNLAFQIISVITRIGYFERNNYNFIINIILDIDYILLFTVYYKLYFKGGIKICLVMEAFLSLLKKMSLKKLLKQLQEKLHKFSQLNKVDKITLIIYLSLSLIWNTLSVVIVLLVANLNHTFIECIFILTSFWLSKRTFGKAFHLSNMLHCFIVSNLSYYVLNRVTTPLGISILIPIMLGVGLSYVTSKLVKKTYKPLYRGMSKDLFDETILNIVDKDSDKYKICYDFYINKKSDVNLSFEYKYSIAGIRKIKERINNKIKELK